MFVLPKNCGNTLHNTRRFSIWSSLNQKSLYDTLGVSPKASQSDVKSAFYKLSKQHHPDANANDPTATARFQEIVEAYEVLGNEAARKRYDVGMPRSERKTSATNGFKSPEDPQAAFYKSRLMNKVNAPSTGRNYDFDTWTKNHYSNSMKDMRILKTNVEARQSGVKARQSAVQTATLQYKFAVTLCTLIFGAYFMMILIGDKDVPKSKR